MRNKITLKSQALSASKWSFLSEIAAKGVTPVIFVVLARLLAPADFGIVAIAAITVSFSQVFWEAGLAKALVQRQSDTEDSAHIVFWTNLVLSLLLYGSLFVTADLLASAFESPEAALVIRVQGLQIILASLCSVQIALYQRDLNFKPLFWVRFCTFTMPGLASIPLAMLGYGYWALVAGTLVGAVMQCAVLWLVNPWRPRWQYDMNLARQLFGFGLWATAEGLVTWLFLWTDVIIVGVFLSVHVLGLYKTGQTVIAMIFAIVFMPLVPVMFSVFSKIKDDRERLLRILNRINKMTVLMALPMGLGIFLIHEQLGGLVFGQAWQGVGFILGITGLVNGVNWLIGPNVVALRALGRPDINTKVMLFSLLIFFPIYAVAASDGLSTFLYTRLATAGFVSLPIQWLIARRFLRFDLWAYLNGMRWIFFAAVFMVLGVLLVDTVWTATPHSWDRLVAQVAVGVASFTLGILLFERTFIKGLYLDLRTQFWAGDRRISPSVGES